MITSCKFAGFRFLRIPSIRASCAASYIWAYLVNGVQCACIQDVPKSWYRGIPVFISCRSRFDTSHPCIMFPYRPTCRPMSILWSYVFSHRFFRHLSFFRQNPVNYRFRLFDSSRCRSRQRQSSSPIHTTRYDATRRSSCVMSVWTGYYFNVFRLPQTVADSIHTARRDAIRPSSCVASGLCRLYDKRYRRDHGETICHHRFFPVIRRHRSPCQVAAVYHFLFTFISNHMQPRWPAGSISCSKGLPISVLW